MLGNSREKEDEKLKAKVTIVSTLPFILTERKPGQIPGYYEIAHAPTKETLGITHVGDAWFPELIPFADEKAPARRIHIPAESVADGIVNDYIGANLAVSHDFTDLNTGAQRLPGLFWVQGVLSGTTVLREYPDRVEKAKLNTIAWFEALVKLADDTWQKFRQHLMITDLQRSAATYLGFKNREWNVNVIEQLASVANCPVCMTQVNKAAVICFNCKYVLNKEEYNKKKDQFATA